ncbi:MAG: hypothetical protein JXA90_00990 [Planctomycetes bacterium]|nr:hypothetical protein [Planctomycetota bacterium]
MEIEDHLRRFRPVDPPAGLKARALAGRRPKRTWPLAAAAALIVAFLWSLNAGLDARLARKLGVPSPAPVEMESALPELHQLLARRQRFARRIELAQAKAFVVLRFTDWSEP